MAEVDAGAVAPVETVSNVPATEQAVSSPDTPAVGEAQQEPVQQQERSYSEQEMRKVVADRLKKEQRRIERAVRAEIRAETAERELERLRGGQPQHQEPGEPQVKDFPDYEEYILARAEWRIEQKQKAARQQEQRQNAQQSETEHYKALASRLREKFKEATEESGEDVEDALRSSPHVTEPMVTYIDDSEHGGKVAAYLAANPKEQERISKLSVTRQVVELDKIEAKLTAASRTQTPPPITPSNARAPATKDSRDMSDAEWLKWREGNLKQHGR